MKYNILFLDDPTVKLDAKGAKSVRDFIRKINREYGITIVLTTHFIFEALKFYPSNLVLAVIQSFVTTGIWFFVSLFLKDYAKSALTEFGGDFVAYMVIGVIFLQNAGNIMNLPEGVRFVSGLVPYTYAMQGICLVMMERAGL